VGNYFFGHSWRFAIYFEPLKALRRASFRATSNPGANVRFGSKADIKPAGGLRPQAVISAAICRIHEVARRDLNEIADELDAQVD